MPILAYNAYNYLCLYNAYTMRTITDGPQKK